MLSNKLIKRQNQIKWEKKTKENKLRKKVT